LFQSAAVVAVLLVAGGLGCSDQASDTSAGGKGGSPTIGGTANASGGTTVGGAIGGVTSSGGSSPNAGGSDTNGSSDGGSFGAGGGTTTGGGDSSGAGGSAGAGGGGSAGGTASAHSGPPMGWASWNSFAAKINLSVMLTVRFADIGLGATAAVRDVWAASDLGMKTTSYSASVAQSDSVLLLVTGVAAQP
jgi:hypothetical protein